MVAGAPVEVAELQQGLRVVRREAPVAFVGGAGRPEPLLAEERRPEVGEDRRVLAVAELQRAFEFRLRLGPVLDAQQQPAEKAPQARFAGRERNRLRRFFPPLPRAARRGPAPRRRDRELRNARAPTGRRPPTGRALLPPGRADRAPGRGRAGRPRGRGRARPPPAGAGAPSPGPRRGARGRRPGGEPPDRPGGRKGRRPARRRLRRAGPPRSAPPPPRAPPREAAAALQPSETPGQRDERRRPDPTGTPPTGNPRAGNPRVGDPHEAESARTPMFPSRRIPGKHRPRRAPNYAVLPAALGLAALLLPGCGDEPPAEAAPRPPRRRSSRWEGRFAARRGCVSSRRGIPSRPASAGRKRWWCWSSPSTGTARSPQRDRCGDRRTSPERRWRRRGAGPTSRRLVEGEPAALRFAETVRFVLRPAGGQGMRLPAGAGPRASGLRESGPPGVPARFPDWEISGHAFTACPCDTPCPCRSNGPPSHPPCTPPPPTRITAGRYGEVELAGAEFVTLGPNPGSRSTSTRSSTNPAAGRSSASSGASLPAPPNATGRSGGSRSRSPKPPRDRGRSGAGR